MKTIILTILTFFQLACSQYIPQYKDYGQLHAGHLDNSITVPQTWNWASTVKFCIIYYLS